MGVRYAMRGVGLIERYYAALRNNSLVFLLVIFTIMLAMYVSIFYIFATGTAMNSLQNLSEDASSNVLDDMMKAKPQSTLPATDTTVQAQVSQQKDDQPNTTSRRSQNVTVNDRVVPVPKNGSSHTVIRNTSGGDVDVSITSSSTGESDTSSTMEVNVESSSSTTKEVE